MRVVRQPQPPAAGRGGIAANANLRHGGLPEKHPAGSPSTPGPRGSGLGKRREVGHDCCPQHRLAENLNRTFAPGLPSEDAPAHGITS
jgi:hypothetical protein